MKKFFKSFDWVAIAVVMIVLTVIGWLQTGKLIQSFLGTLYYQAIIIAVFAGVNFVREFYKEFK